MFTVRRLHGSRMPNDLQRNVQPIRPRDIRKTTPATHFLVEPQAFSR